MHAEKFNVTCFWTFFQKCLYVEPKLLRQQSPTNTFFIQSKQSFENSPSVCRQCFIIMLYPDYGVSSSNSLNVNEKYWRQT